MIFCRKTRTGGWDHPDPFHFDYCGVAHTATPCKETRLILLCCLSFCLSAALHYARYARPDLYEIFTTGRPWPSPKVISFRKWSGLTYYRTLIGSRECFVQRCHPQWSCSTFQGQTRKWCFPVKTISHETLALAEVCSLWVCVAYRAVTAKARILFFEGYQRKLTYSILVYVNNN